MIPIPGGRELPLNPLWWLAFAAWGTMTLIHRDWGKVWRVRRGR